MAYTGPIPPTPTASSTDAQWASWWAYQTVLTNGRYDDERAARAIVTDQQHAEKMAAEASCAAAQQDVATAIQAQTAAARYIADTPTPLSPLRLPTRAELVFSILRDHPQATILTNGQLVSGCKGIVDAFVAAYPSAVQP
jgi:hypothetical protein